MKKKIFKISLLLIFFISTTGLPVTVYLCNMDMNTGCEMMNKSMKASHCINENVDFEYTYSSSSMCCKAKTIDSSIKDSFVSFKTELKFNLVELQNSILNITNDISLESRTFLNLTNLSPPGLKNNNIYLNNSILLI